MHLIAKRLKPKGYYDHSQPRTPLVDLKKFAAGLHITASAAEYRLNIYYDCSLVLEHNQNKG